MGCTGHERYQCKQTRRLKIKPPPKRVSFNQNFMFLSDVHSFVSVVFRLYQHKVCTVLQISLPENHIQHYLWTKKLCCRSSGWSPWSYEEWFWKGFQEDLQYWSSPEYALEGDVCLPWGKKKKSVVRNILKKYVALLHESAPFSVSFPSLHLALLSSQCSSSLEGRAWMDLGWLQRRERSLMEGLCLRFCVCFRDLLELSPPDRQKAALQYASWGPQGNQLVSEGLTYLSSSDSIKTVNKLFSPFTILNNTKCILH